MTSLGPIAEVAAQPRTFGSAALSVGLDGARTRLVNCRQEGALKILWPRPGAGPMEAVALNTSGGLTGGDRLSLSASLGAGAELVITTQAAERACRAQPGSEAQVETRLDIGPGGRLDWLPQETILFDGAALRRRLTATLAGDAALVAVEALLIGRRAMGEQVRRLTFSDGWDIRRDGVPVFADRLRLSGDAEAALDRAAVGGGARAVASLLMAGPAASSLLDPLRAVLPASGGASLVRQGVLFARILAPDGFALRQCLLPAIAVLTGRPVPKVWRL